MQKTKLFAWSFLLLVTLPGAAALAQGAPQTPAPAPQPTAQPAPPAAQPAAPAAEPAPRADDKMPPPPPCFPACREGFLCGEGGQCVTACNPACGPGERCTADAQCVIDSQVSAAPEGAPQYVPPPAAPPPPPEEGVETHDGVMLRFTLGLGGGSMSEDVDDGRIEGTASGAGMLGSVDIGAAITDELTIHGRLGFLQMFSPSLEEDGEEVDLAYGVSLFAVIFGPGLTYNIMPLNMYVTAVGGLHVVGFTYDEEDEDFDEDFRDQPTGGFALNLDVGKEWWVTTQTGIGVAGRFWWGTGGAEYERSIGPISTGPIESERNLIAFGLLFSVTHQ